MVLCLLVGKAAASGAGTTGANLLKVAMGVRQAGMGGVGTALPGDLAGTLSNPALLSYVSSRSVQLIHWPGMGGLRTEFASYSIPVGWLGTWAGTVLYRTLPPIDNAGLSEEAITVNDGMVMMGLGRPLGRSGWLGGANVKLFNSSLGDIRATSGAVDLGVMRATPGAEPVRYGLAVDNLGLPIKHESVSAALPLTLRGGASWTKQWYPHSLTIATEGCFNWEMDARAAAGVEWLQQGKLALRAGINASRYAGWSWSLGTGWHMRSAAFGPEAEYEIEYAFVPFPLQTVFEPTHAFSLYIKF